MIKTITVNELKELLEQQDVLFIDVREPSEYQAACIAGTVLIPLNTICVDKLPTTEGPIVIHCGSGKRSATACERLLAEDPTLDVYSLEGGIKAWKAAGCDVDQK